MSIFEINSTQLQEWLGNYSLKFALTEYGDVMDVDKNAMIAEFVQNLNAYLNKEVAYHQKEQKSESLITLNEFLDDLQAGFLEAKELKVGLGLPKLKVNFERNGLKFEIEVKETE